MGQIEPAGEELSKSETTLMDWVSFIQGYKSWIDGSLAHFESYSWVLVGAIIVLGGLIWGLGFDVFLLFVVMAGVPLGAFAYHLFKRRRSATFWLIEISLLVAWLIPLLLQIFGVEIGREAPSQAGLLFWGSYFTMPFLGGLYLYVRSHVVQFIWLSHGLDMLTQAVMYGLVTDTGKVMKRFHGMTWAISRGYKARAIQYARFRCIMDRLPTEGLSDDILHRVICNIRTPNDVKELERVVGEAVEEALKENKMVKRNSPGLVTLYVAPRDMAREIPKHSRGRFRIWSQSSLQKKELIIRKIQTKGRSNQLRDKGPGLLVVYDRFLSAEQALSFFEDPADDIGTVLARYPGLSALVLISPPLLLESVTERAMSEEHRVYIEHSLPDREGERINIWKNKHGDFPFPEVLVNVLKNYPRNLSRLFSSSITSDQNEKETRRYRAGRPT